MPIYILGVLLEEKGRHLFTKILLQEWFLNVMNTFRKFTLSQSKLVILIGGPSIVTNLSLWELVCRERGKTYWLQQQIATKRKLTKLRQRLLTKALARNTWSRNHLRSASLNIIMRYSLRYSSHTQMTLCNSLTHFLIPYLKWQKRS